MHYYTDVIKQYTVFGGRMARKEYWMFVLCNFIVTLIVSTIAKIVDVSLLNTLYALAVLLPSLGALSRRLHDTGRSAWWILIALVPLIGWIVLLVFAILAGNSGQNAYGADPKQASPAPVV